MEEPRRPASWLVVEHGWAVVGSDGEELGTIAEVIGDAGTGIFDGIAVSPGALQRARYVAAERVGDIDEGRVRLELTASEFEGLDDYTGAPPASNPG